ncbi:tetratricopeptide repeat protein [Rhizobium sp. LC145]|uniref:tetratricopeptide repeat protein n=1 Tax=Rhizobium sp. LC145 TaxID=1120688 RepID=UPI00069C05E1|nr:tetratricopeptide repeat protein [Rhizobium sp. LC145]
MKSRFPNVNKVFAVAAGAATALCTLTILPAAGESIGPAIVMTAVNDCDRLAGSPTDNQRNSAHTPVDAEKIDAAAIDACRTAHDATDNPRFAFQLGRALNTAQRMGESVAAFDTAVQAGYPAAKVHLGMLMGRLGDEASEFRLYKEAAESGNVLAAYNLGVAYRDGLGTKQDVAQALRWFETAASAGDDTAAFNIGVIYDEGNLLPQDDQTAIAWYDIAAQRGNADAMINLGIMYETGEGIAANPTKAAEMYASAAERGDVFGAYKLMQMQQAGTFPPPSGQELSDDLEGLVLKEGDMEMPSSMAKGI